MKLLLLAVICVVSAVSASWWLEHLDSEGSTGTWTAIRLDSSGYLHITYSDDTDAMLMHAYQAGSAWQLEQMHACSGAFLAMVLDSLDRPVTAYWDTADSTVRILLPSGMGWISESLAVAIPFDLSWTTLWPRVDVEIDGAARPHVVWYDGADGALHHTLREPNGTWVTSLVDTSGNTGVDPSLAMDSLDRPCVSYTDMGDGHLYFACLDGSAWQVEVADSACADASTTSLVLDGSGAPHILYLGIKDWGDSPVYCPLYAHRDEGGWISEVALQYPEPYIFPTSPQDLCLDAEGKPHYAQYTPEYGGYLGYTYRDADGWHSEGVDGFGAGFCIAICMDDQGNPNISFWHFGDEDLVWAHRSPTGIWEATSPLPDLTEGLSLTVVPNPCTGSASLSLDLRMSVEVIIAVYDVAGRCVSVPFEGALPAGTHRIPLDPLPAGFYQCTAEAAGMRLSCPFLMLD